MDETIHQKAVLNDCDDAEKPRALVNVPWQPEESSNEVFYTWAEAHESFAKRKLGGNCPVDNSIASQKKQEKRLNQSESLIRFHS